MSEILEVNLCHPIDVSNFVECMTFLIQGAMLKLQMSQAHVSRKGENILPVILGHVHIYS